MQSEQPPGKTDAEIYEDAKRRRWPYVDEPRPGIPPPKRPRRPEDGVGVEQPRPRPGQPGEAVNAG